VAPAEVLQRAIQAARAGRKIEARDLLIQIVETDPENEMAWVWLSGLVDSLEDRIIACEPLADLRNALAMGVVGDEESRVATRKREIMCTDRVRRETTRAATG